MVIFLSTENFFFPLAKKCKSATTSWIKVRLKVLKSFASFWTHSAQNQNLFFGEPPPLVDDSKNRSHRSRGKSRNVKKCRTKLRALWKSARQERRNEPSQCGAPHDIAVRLPQNPFLVSLWIGSGLGDPEADWVGLGDLEAGQKGILG